MRCNTTQEVADASTAVPRTDACKSPMISSSENNTAAIGVLNAAAIRHSQAGNV